MNNTPIQKITLEDIVRQKDELQIQIKKQEEAMASTIRSIYAPFAPATTKAGSLMRTFNIGMAIFDGVVMGINIMRKVKRNFRKLR